MRAVLEKDFLAEAVRPRAFAARFAIGGLASLSLLGIAVANAGNLVSAPDTVGASAFRALSVLLLSGVALVAPALLAGSLVPERARGTLTLLLAAPLRPTGIALAKFLAGAGTALLWGAAALPPLGICVMFGGVSPDALLQLFLAVLAVALECGAYALLVSAWARGLGDAAMFVYALPAARWFTCAALGDMLPAPLGPLLRSSVPLATAFPDAFAVPAAPTGGALAWLAASPGLASFLAALALAPIPVLLAGSLLAREGAGFATRTTHRLRPTELEQRLRLRLTRGNPVAWKETLLLHSGSSRILFYATFALLGGAEVVSIAMSGQGRWDANDDLYLLAGSTALIAAIAALSGAVSVVQETTKGTMELLRCSLLTPREIAGGKALGLGLGMSILFVVPLLHALLATAAGGLHPLAALAWLACSFVVIGVHGLQGMRWGAAAPAPWAAVAGAVAFTIIGHLSALGLCFAVVVVAAVRGRAREDSTTAAFCDEVALPGLLCFGGFFVSYGLPAVAQSLTGDVSGSAFPNAGGFLGGVALVAPVVILATRWKTLPAALERQMRRTVDGERPRLRLFRAGGPAAAGPRTP